MYNKIKKEHCIYFEAKFMNNIALQYCFILNS